MDRRTFVTHTGRAAALLGATPLVPRGLLVPPTLTFAAVGDCILTQKVSERRDEPFLKVRDLVRDVDCAWANCEMTFLDHRDAFPAPKGRDMNLVCEPWGADELAWMGVDVVGTANNHAKDYGDEGLLGTIRNLERVGIAHTGTGRDLQEAARPSYVETPGGRVAQVNCASTFPDWSLAAPSTPSANGRPGLNPVRVNRYTQITPERFEELKALRTAVSEAAGRRGPPGEGSDDEEINFQGTRFVRGPANDVFSEPDPRDVARITEAVGVAKRSARMVMVTIHAHEGYRDRQVPDRFLSLLATACIDAGADTFIGTGPHVLRGIEIYKGKPIFYSLGNFFFQYATVKQIPAEVFEANALAPTTADPTLSYDKFNFPNDPLYWESVVPQVTFTEDGVRSIELRPVTLGREEPRYARGTPILAAPEDADRILGYLTDLCKPFGTTLSVRNGVGHVVL